MHTTVIIQIHTHNPALPHSDYTNDTQALICTILLGPPLIYKILPPYHSSGKRGFEEQSNLLSVAETVSSGSHPA